MVMAEGYTVVSLSPLRKVIAARMTEATRTIPHFRLVADMEVDALLTLREEMNVVHPEAKVSLNDCLIKACASALVEHPVVNSQLVGNDVHRFHQADISIVMAIEGGLSTPVIRQANKKSVRDIAKEAKALASRAAKGQLKMEEITGGSFSVSNLGMYGVDQFDAIINPPQCAILAIGCTKPHFVVSPEREARIATLLRVTLSVDHRALDGATAAAFLTSLRRRVEQPGQLFSSESER